MNRCRCFALAIVVAVSLQTVAQGATNEVRSAKHQQFAGELWVYLTGPSSYTSWKQADQSPALTVGPMTSQGDRFYLNPLAASASAQQPHGAIIVAEHRAGEPQENVAVSVWYKMNSGYHPRYGDWYFAHYAPDGTVLMTSADDSPHAKRGFVAIQDDGRLWVFAAPSAELIEFHTAGELAKHVIRPGAGPGGVTLKAPDAETIDRYLTAKDGYVTKMEDGRLWVFRADAEELREFESAGELAKHIIRPGAGPGGITIKAPDAETIDGYLN